MKAFLRNLLASIVGFFISLFLLFSFFIILVVAIAAGGKKEVSIKKDSVIRISLDEAIPERPTDNPLEGFAAFSDEFKLPLSLKTIVDNLERAKNDDKIKGIYLDLSLVQSGLSTLEEIRNALLDFKKSGKFIYAYSELYNQKNYYIASVADSIFFNNQGLFSFTGFHNEQMFFKGTLEKLDVDLKLFRAGKYKSAGETFTRSEMSKEGREQLTAFINSAYKNYLSKISEARGIDTATLRKIAGEGLVRFPEDAVKHKLVDKLYYKDQVIASLKNRLKIDQDKELEPITLYDYSKSERQENPHSDNKIAVIYAVGQIMGGEGSDDQVGSEKLSEAIRKAREDDKVKAIVLRINSPGGSALASDIIWREVVLARDKKPVIASMGDVAASGGYYIAAPAHTIVAQPNTVTGSIGVFALFPNLSKFWNNKLGITWDRVKTGKFADFGNPNRPLLKEEEEIFQQYIDRTYKEFKQRVANGRKLKESFVDSIAQGRIYSGIQAKEIGLVDEFGNLDYAIKLAAEKAKLKDYKLEILPEYHAGFSKIMQGLTSVKEQILVKQLDEEYYILKKAQDIKNMQGVMMLIPFEFDVY